MKAVILLELITSQNVGNLSSKSHVKAEVNIWINTVIDKVQSGQ
jgi:hypothetical protein